MPTRPVKKPIEHWAADVTYGDEQFGMYADGLRLEGYFPRRADIDNPEKMIDAMLAVYYHPQWPRFERPISRESALRVIYAVAIADAIHEVTELIKFNGVRPVKPHPQAEDQMWDTLLDVAQTASVRLLKELERNKLNDGEPISTTGR